MFAQRRVDGADGRSLGHPPGMNQRNIIIAAEDFNHRRRQRRPADKRSFKMRQANIRFTQRGKQTGPDDRNAEGDADLLFAQQPQQAVAVQIRPRQNQASARHRGNKRRAPGIDVEHRHHRQQRVLCRYTGRIRLIAAQRMQYQRAVGIQHPFRLPRGPGGIAQRGWRIFAHLGPAIRRIRFSDQLIKKQQRIQRGERFVIPRRQQNKMLYRWQVGPQRADKRQKGVVEKQNLVRGIIDDKGEMFRGQAWIDGMRHPSPRTDAKIDFQMTAIIPRQRAAAGACREIQPMHGGGQMPGVIRHLSPGTVLPSPQRPDRDNSRIAMISRGMFNERPGR